MLRSLTIRNYVLIDRLDIRLGKGLSVITGETGAGKSIILGALGLVLGQRADGKSIRSGAEKCLVEAAFNVSAYDLSGFFAEHDLEYDAGNCILRRELFASGKSRAFVNDSPAPLSVLKELGSRLIDIHSQHANLLLGDGNFQLKVADVMAGNAEALAAYRDAYDRYRGLQRDLGELSAKAAQTKQDEDYLRFQLEQLSGADLTAGEQSALEDEQALLSHAEDIKAGLYKITGLLQDDDRGALRPMKEALSAASALQRCYPKALSIAERLRSAYADLSDLAADTAVQQEDVAFDSHRLDAIHERLDVLYGLQQKYHAATVEELIALREEYKGRLLAIDSFDEQIDRLRQAVEAAQAELLRHAALLHESRQKAAQTIAKDLVVRLAALGMPNARFEVSVAPRTEPAADGMDEVRFLFAAHRNVPLQVVAQTASGGELSRLMLCIKAMIAGFTALPAIVFDEADTGVSGDIADKTGEIMQEMSRSMQVITITHLPQIAAKGQAHYLVYKEDTPERTATGIRPLDEEERTREVARMLSGASLTEASMANARELLRPATPPAGNRQGSAA